MLVPIPARTNAVRERGFDHISLMGAELSRITGMPLTPLLRAKPRRDQRNLDARQRLANMAGSFDLEPNGPSPYGNALKARLGIMPRIVLIDDVFTTGATLFTAGNTLRAAGAKEIYAVTSSEHKPPRNTAKTARLYRLAASNPLEPRRGCNATALPPPAEHL